MDINLPEMDGIETTQRILEERPSTIVIGLSFETDEFVVRQLKAAGAVTCVAKERAMGDVYRAIVDAVQERRPRCN
jgi:DNA-binding NarL/FixJ family response regulator